MRTLKTKEEIFENIPELTDEDYVEMNNVFTPFLFFLDHKKEGYRECWCTRCNEHFNYDYLQRIEEKNHYEFIRKRHNEYGVCPKCGRTVQIKNCNLAKRCNNLNEWKRMVVFKPVSKTEVYLLCYFGCKEYQGSYTPKPTYQLSVVYYITPDVVRNFKCQYSYWWQPVKLVDDDFVERKSICEPFTRTYDYNWSSYEKRGYSSIGTHRLKDTFLKYVPWDLFAETYEKFVYTSYSNSYSFFEMYEIPQIKFLCYYALYPSTERLLKIGLGDFVCSLVQNRPMKRFIDWKANTPKEMFHMNNAEFKEFRTHYQSFDDFKLFQLFKGLKKGITYTEVHNINKLFGVKYEVTERVAKTVKKYNLNLTHTLNYISKHTRKSDMSHTAILWLDYLNFATDLKYDLSRDDVIFPKRLKETHDSASKNLQIQNDKIAFENYKKRYKQLQKMYEYSDGVYQIVIPLGVADIVAEGKILSHCVGGYAQRHVEGFTTIVFMRKCNDLDKRLVTIEVRDKEKRICQNYGYKDRNVTKAEKAFIDKWIAWVKAGSKRPKKKKTASAA